MREVDGLVRHRGGALALAVTPKPYPFLETRTPKPDWRGLGFTYQELGFQVS